MSIPWETARDEWATRKVIEQQEVLLKAGIPIGVTYANGDRVIWYEEGPPPNPDEITIIDIDIEPGGDYQIGDMTWDHDDPSIEITYEINGRHGTVNVELDFGKLVQEIVAVAEDLS